ncbi:disease resistance protein RUN1-like [Macadamia integrifolia]|uniref:disease resistance protein RUN1-like n=1 Tax=Macadamia integrifolia TaxID=60698 RepID=UPI001C4FC8D3|nr:disease resistance protein RUN1-like [Macadamia integrifolia]
MCEKMINLHESIGDLKSLVMLDLYGTQIEELPDSICRLSSLKYLILGPGSSLENLPKSIGDLKSLVDLDLHRTQIEELPERIRRLSSLGKLILNGCVSLRKLSKLPSTLTHLKVESCISLQKLPSLSSLKNLRELNLSNCKMLEEIQGLEATKSLVEFSLYDCDTIETLPEVPLTLTSLKIESCFSLQKLPYFSGLKNLRDLVLSDRDKLEEIRGLEATISLEEFSLYDCDTIETLPELSSTLTSLKIKSCFSLQKLPDFSVLKNLRELFLSDCDKLEEIRGLEGTESLEKFGMYHCKTITDTPRKRLGQGKLLVDLFSGSYSLNLNDGIYKGLILCLVFELDINEQGRRRNTGKDIIYIHHFKGFDWFGFPLKGIDAIEEISVQGRDCDVKFWKLLPENTETDQRMVADFF